MLMAKARVSSDELARQIGVPATTIKRIRNNEHANPTIYTLAPIANYFSVSLNELIGIKNSTNINHVIREIPLLSWQECIRYKEIRYTEQTQFIPVEIEVSEKAFALVVEDTDLDFFPKNCILIVDTINQALNGDYIVVANMEHNVASIRKYIVEIDQIYLKSLIPGIGASALTSEYVILGVILQYKMELRIKNN